MKKLISLVLALALCFGLVGFLDDFCKVKFKRDLGLTAFQKAALQMAGTAVYLYALYRTGTMTSNLYIPFVEQQNIYSLFSPTVFYPYFL